jgi:hypothetical protein
VFMAAVAGEFIKGYHVAHEACRLLRQTRADFDLIVTFDPPGPGSQGGGFLTPAREAMGSATVL